MKFLLSILADVAVRAALKAVAKRFPRLVVKLQKATEYSDEK